MIYFDVTVSIQAYRVSNKNSLPSHNLNAWIEVTMPYMHVENVPLTSCIRCRKAAAHGELRHVARDQLGLLRGT